MIKLIVLVVIAFLVLTYFGVKGKLPNDLPIKIEPDSKIYFLELWYEKMIIFFTFDLELRAGKYQLYAEKRLDETDELIAQGKTELAEKQQELYSYFLKKAKNVLEDAFNRALRRGEEELSEQINKKIEEIKIKIQE